MPPEGPWDSWDRNSLGSLHRRHEAIEAGKLKGDPILPEDLALLIEHDERCVADPLRREYLLKALRGQLKRSRGRKKSARPDYVLIMAEVWIEQEREQVLREIASGKLRRSRGDPGPPDIAADRVARYLGHTAGGSLKNEISRMRNRHKKMSA